MTTLKDASNKYPGNTNSYAIKGDYPYRIVTEHWADGTTRIVDITPGKENITETHGPSGTHKVINTDGSTLEHNNGVVKHIYNKGSSSSHDEGHTDSSTDSTKRNSVFGSALSETATNEYNSAGQHSVNLSGGSSFHASTSGNKYSHTEGDMVTGHKGNIHTNVEGDVVEKITGNKASLHSGDYAHHHDSGSYDIQILNGNFKLTCKNFIIEAETMSFTTSSGPVTIKTADLLNLISNKATSLTSAGSISLTSTGSITTQGSATLIQGGGGSLPPKTFS